MADNNREPIVFTEDDFDDQTGPGRKPDIIDRILPRNIPIPFTEASIPIAEAGGRGRADFPRGELNVAGEIFERPQATIREAIRARGTGLGGVLKGAVRGFRDPLASPSFFERSQAQTTEQAFQQEFEPTGNRLFDAVQSAKIKAKLAGRDIGALGLDIVTDPLILLGLKGGKQAIGAARKFEPAFKASFVEKNIIPRTENLFAKSFNSFGKGIQNFMKRKVPGTTDDMIEHISKNGVRNIQVKAKAIGTLDDISLKGQSAMINKSDDIAQAYKDAFKNIKDRDLINIDDAFGEMQKVLSRHGVLDTSGRVKQNFLRFGDDSKLKSLAVQYEALSPVGSFNQALNTPLKIRKAGVGGVNKTVWQDFRDALSKSSVRGGQSRITDDIVGISDKLHTQAGKQGINVSKGRGLSKEHFKHAKAGEKFASEGNIKNVLKSKQSARELQVLDKYLGTNLLDDAKTVLSSESLDKVAQFGVRQAGNPSLIRGQIEAAAGKKVLQSRTAIKTEVFEDLLGKSKELDNIFKDLNTFNRNKTIKHIGKRAAQLTGGATLLNAVVGNPIQRAIRESFAGGNVPITGGGGGG